MCRGKPEIGGVEKAGGVGDDPLHAWMLAADVGKGRFEEDGGAWAGGAKAGVLAVPGVLGCISLSNTTDQQILRKSNKG